MLCKGKVRSFQRHSTQRFPEATTSLASCGLRFSYSSAGLEAWGPRGGLAPWEVPDHSSSHTLHRL